MNINEVLAHRKQNDDLVGLLRIYDYLDNCQRKIQNSFDNPIIHEESFINHIADLMINTLQPTISLEFTINENILEGNQEPLYSIDRTLHIWSRNKWTCGVEIEPLELKLKYKVPKKYENDLTIKSPRGVIPGIPEDTTHFDISYDKFIEKITKFITEAGIQIISCNKGERVYNKIDKRWTIGIIYILKNHNI